MAYSGTEQYSGKESKEVLQPAPPPCEWYRANEWNLMLWATYAFSANEGRDTIFDFNIDGIEIEFEENTDRWLDKDNAWGGGGDIKYFFSKYWGLGAQGFVLDGRNAVGAALGTFTFRFPIGCSRFAPYAWAGIGGAFGGSQTEFFTVRDTDTGDVLFLDTDTHESKHAELMGQFGTGIEVRITRPSDMSKIAVGVMADIAWNIVDEPDNNFGMGRLGVTLSY